LADDDEVQIEPPSAKANKGKDKEIEYHNKPDIKVKTFEHNNLSNAVYSNYSGNPSNLGDKGKTPQELNPNRYESSHDFYNYHIESNAPFQSISQFEYWCKKLDCKVPDHDYYDGIVKMRPENPYGCTYAPRPTLNYASNSRSRLGGINNINNRRGGKRLRQHLNVTNTTPTESQNDQSQQPTQEQLEPLAPNWYETKDEYEQIYYYNKYIM